MDSSDKPTHHVQQSYTHILSTGFIASILVLCISATFIFSVDHIYFMNNLSLAFMAATPAQVVLGLYWRDTVPGLIENQIPPIKGVLLCITTMTAGSIILLLFFKILSGGHGVTPMLSQYAILTVVVSVWLVVVLEAWPFTLFTKNPLFIGILVWIATYAVAYGLQQVFYDYSFLGSIHHPAYFSELDPKGLFGFWHATSFSVTVVMVILLTLLYDLWPINTLAGRSSQPLRGVIGSLYTLVIAIAVFSLFVHVLQWDPVDYMVRVPVCLIFGSFLANNMMQFSLFNRSAQPFRGICLTLVTIIVAIAMYYLYAYAADLHAGRALGTGGANDYEKEIWIASAMLGVTFPIIFVVSGFFAFWPIKRG